MTNILKLLLLAPVLAFIFNVLFWLVCSVFVLDLILEVKMCAFPFTFLSSEFSRTDPLFTYGVILWVVAFLQASVFCLSAPSPASPGDAAPLLPRVLAAGAATGMIVAVPVMALTDIFTLQYGNRFGMYGVFGGCGVWALSWFIWTPILLHRARSDADFLEKQVAKSVKGTALGLVLCLPWLFVLRKKESCYCGFSTFWALVVGFWSLLVLGGPLLLLLARERRIRASLR